MMKHGVVAILVAVCLLPLRLLAAEPLTLGEAMALAVERNPDIQVARGEERISHNRVNIGNAGLLPTVSLAGTATWQDNERASQTSSGTFSEFTSNSAQVKASYTLFDGFGNIYTFRKLKSGGRLGSLQARNDIEAVLLELSDAYYRTAKASEDLTIAREALDISDERLRRARLRAEYGQSNTVELLSAEVDANSDSIAVRNARLEYSSASRALNTLLDRDVDTPLELSPEVAFDETLTFEKIMEQARAAFAGYLIALEQVRQAGYDHAIARSDYFPEFDLQFSYGYSSTAEGFDIGLDDPSESMSASLSMNYPIFSGWKRSIARQNARIATQNSELLARKAELELERLVGDTWEAYQNSLGNLEFQQTALKTAELNFERTGELYKLGQATTTSFREAQINLVQARSDRAQARYDARMFELRLLRLAGMLVISM
ncbi:TolC family protein [Prosthecochloris sp. CIB 2401]|uniref:TolC family protein n=1 Tax=Prosthecochloris sp. CIB 2401 TaxID=1868325 RepID=UPI00080AB76E|nr:TolC family protein [Prosthecochloris sp. CIB 2401]ANT65229.1 Outer membrane efflux protein BepC precursor [Prosthecochloris sp. CIB 2401]